MRYEGSVFRPPSEAGSLIVQVTIGCSHNQCTFCSMYKVKNFRIKSLETIIEELHEARHYHSHVERIFLADGNALVMPMSTLVPMLETISILFPECERVGIYGAPKDILGKTAEELALLKEKGLGIVYLGVETGNDGILKQIHKGVNAKQMIEAGKKVVASGIKLSTMIISGLGGADNWQAHAMDSAKVINAIDPDYVGLLTLLIEPGTPLFDDVHSGKFVCLSPEQVLEEARIFVKSLKLSRCIFRSNHASNYLALSGTLPMDKEKLIRQIEYGLTMHFGKRQEAYRRL